MTSRDGHGGLFAKVVQFVGAKEQTRLTPEEERAREEKRQARIRSMRRDEEIRRMMEIPKSTPATAHPQVAPQKFAHAVAPPSPAITQNDSDDEMDLDFTTFLSNGTPSSAKADDDMDLDFTNLAAAEPGAHEVSAHHFESTIPAQLEEVAFESAEISNFSELKIESIELGQGQYDPTLQEAAIAFANGEFKGAEALLMEFMQNPSTPTETAEFCALALLDLYKATDQESAFENMALEIAQRFGRSTPEWLSIPGLLKKKSKPIAQTDRSSKQWHCPGVLDLAFATKLSEAQVNSVQWGSLERIEPDAIDQLHTIFSSWTEKAITLSFQGQASLNKVLEKATPAGDISVNPKYWLCRLECLRMQDMNEDYENVALDYCVTYEVSPPGWVAPRCTLSIASETPSDEKELTFPTLDETPGPLDFSGEILGDAENVMRSLSERTPAGQRMVVSCSQLIRIDFAAAGSLLNWLSERGSRAKVEFVNVPRLVATFFSVMGINQHATVITSLH